MYVPYLRKFTKENEKFKEDFKLHIIRLIDCFCDLLKKVDVQFFSNSKKLGSQMMPKQVSKEPKRSSSIVKQSSDAADTFDNLVINQESDIVLIIGGL